MTKRFCSVVCAFVCAALLPAYAGAQITPLASPAGFSGGETLLPLDALSAPVTNVAGTLFNAGGVGLHVGVDCDPRPFGPSACIPFGNVLDNRSPILPIEITFAGPQTRIAFESRFNGYGQGITVSFFFGATLVGTQVGPPGVGPISPNPWVWTGFQSVTPFNRVILAAPNNGFIRLDNLRFENTAGSFCGDGTVDAGEACDDGNIAGGDGCSATCAFENNAPTALCAPQAVFAGASCTAAASINAGSSDPDAGDTITVSQSPAGPYPLGATNVSLTVTDNHGASDSCSATVTVIDNTAPSVSCPAPAVIECSGGSATATIAASAADNCSPVAASCTASSGSFPAGTTNYSCSATDAAGNTGTCSSSVTVVDSIAPSAACVPSVNPAGKNKPNANAGFVQVSGGDTCAAVTITLGGYTLTNGETIKITVDPSASGVTLVGTMGPSGIKHFVVGPGMGQITVSDGIHTTTAACGGA